MRRSVAVFVMLALSASMLGLATSASSVVSPVAIAPGTTPDTGTLSFDPASVEEGGKVKVIANFPDGVYMVRLYKETTTPGTWVEVASDESNAAGNAYMYDYQVNGKQDVYARITSGGTGRTEVRTLTPTVPGEIGPTGPDTGNLTTDPATFTASEKIKVVANFPDGVSTVKLYKEATDGTWDEVDTDESNTAGNAYFYDYQVTEPQRVFARKSNGDRTEIDTLAPISKVSFDMQRDCNGSDCKSLSEATATATGVLDPAHAGRVFTLQRSSGSSWVSVTGASPTATGADGKVEITFPLAGIPQYTARVYRLTSPAVGSSPAVTSSHTISFMPGPNQLGPNVLRVDVDGGKFPTTKGPVYTGDATLSVDGVVTHDQLLLEDFGVRGSSTSIYTKRPYKLKFEDKPDVKPFGMTRGKNWSLLASWLDLTLMRDKAGLDLGRKLAPTLTWTPDSRFVELFVNDQYRGSYTLTESVKIDKTRVDIDEEKGMIMEVDGASVSDTSLGFLSTIGKIAFIFKDPDERKTLDGGGADPTSVTSAKLTAVKNRINALESKLYSTARVGPNGYAAFIDVPSAIDFYLVKEFTKDHDADFYRSHYFSWNMGGTQTEDHVPTVLDDGKFHFGPVWDFDQSAGAATDSDPVYQYFASPTGWYLRGTGTGARPNYKTHWYVQMFKDPAFEAAVKARWAVVKPLFKQIGDADIATYRSAIGVGATNDKSRWAGEPRRYQPHGSTYDAEVAYVTKWYKDRYNWMDGQLSN